jgi:phosphatidylinositol glycan class O
MPRRFRRVLFVIVDALRFDFTLYTRPAKSRGMVDGVEAEEDFYVNNMPFINDLLRNNASNTFLFRFVADAPTTTLQRLKALNTGGIPTFLEAKNNFDSSELSEDNLIAQMRDNGRGVVFMGDDTWAKLFPPHKRYFARCHPFPSFNVKDLHTVDDGVMRHLFPEMRDESTPRTLHRFFSRLRGVRASVLIY